MLPQADHASQPRYRFPRTSALQAAFSVHYSCCKLLANWLKVRNFQPKSTIGELPDHLPYREGLGPRLMWTRTHKSISHYIGVIILDAINSIPKCPSDWWKHITIRQGCKEHYNDAKCDPFTYILPELAMLLAKSLLYLMKVQTFGELRMRDTAKGCTRVW